MRDFCVAPARALTSKIMLDFCAFMLMMKPNILPNRIIYIFIFTINESKQSSSLRPLTHN